MMDPALSVLGQVITVFDELGIDYALVGSMASSVHGLYRSTADLDMLVDLRPEQTHPLFKKLMESFYVDDARIRDAVAHRSSFNAIHFDSAFKVDVFVAGDDEFARMQLQHRELREAPDSEHLIYVASAEDTILAKLRWYRVGNEVSNNQWSDVVGILAINQGRLDIKYLEFWSERLGVRDLLAKALDEAN